MTKKAAPIFAIGDIHGCAPELHRLLAKLPLTSDSTIIFLGDLIDRGNYSREVVSTVLDLSSKYKVIALMGNHEDMFLEFLMRSGSHEGASFIMNGGSSTLASYADDNGRYLIPTEHIEFFRSMRLYYETEDYVFVHAGLPEIPLKEIDPLEHRPVFLWTRHPFLSSEYDWGKIVVHGHTPMLDPEFRSNRINIDTGCYYDGKLTALEVNSLQVYSVEKAVKNEPRLFLRDKASNRVATRFPGKIDVIVQKDGQDHAFTTYNYNEFGLLLAEEKGKQSPSLNSGEIITGSVGNHEHRKIFFEGEVVRREDRANEYLYGVRLISVTPADEMKKSD